MAATATFEHALVTRLLADVDVAALVATRITAAGLETDIVRPYVAIRRLTTIPSNTLEKTGRGPTNVLFDISSFGDSLDAAIELAQAVRVRLIGFVGTVTVGGDNVVFSAIYWRDEQDFEPRIGAKVYRRQQQYSVWGTE